MKATGEQFLSLVTAKDKFIVKDSSNINFHVNGHKFEQSNESC